MCFGGNKSLSQVFIGGMEREGEKERQEKRAGGSGRNT